MKKLTYYRALIGDPVLRKKAKPLSLADIKSLEFKRLITQLNKWIKSLDLVGMAAPQLGVGFAVAVINIRETKFRKTPAPWSRILINPKIESYGTKKINGWEGCGSIPAYLGVVTRSSTVTVSYLDLDGVKHIEKVEGFNAVVAQHEIDHLNGILFTDRMTDFSTFMHVSELKKLQKIKSKAKVSQKSKK